MVQFDYVLDTLHAQHGPLPSDSPANQLLRPPNCQIPIAQMTIVILKSRIPPHMYSDLIYIRV